MWVMSGGKSVGYAAITHTFQPMKSIRSDVPCYKYILLASERSERDTLRSVQSRIADIYII